MDKKQYLIDHGWIVGERNSRLNTDFEGKFMCAVPFEEKELPTRDGSNGPWCIVGDDLDELIDDAYEFASESFYID